jgi:membrane fusion protein (multidrug efflux system)
MKRFLLFLLFIVVTLTVLKLLLFPSKRAAPPGAAKPAAGALAVTGVIASPSEIDQTIFATGSVLANEEVDLHPEVAGKLTAISFKEGSAVTRGQLLIKINDADLQAQLHRNDLDRKLAEERLKRNEKLVQMKGISEQEYEELQNAVAGLSAERDLLIAQIAKTEIRAPFNGRIGLKSVSEGSYVTPTTLIASLQQIDPVKIDFSIPEKYAYQVHKGDEIIFTTGGSNKTFSGNIYAIEPKVDDQTRTVQIRALCPNANAEVLPGAFARITLVLKKLNNVLMVPTESIVPVLKGKLVYVARNGKVDAVKVETGIRNDSTVQVLSGLSPHDTVITTGMMQLKPNMPVSVKLMK